MLSHHFTLFEALESLSWCTFPSSWADTLCELKKTLAMPELSVHNNDLYSFEPIREIWSMHLTQPLSSEIHTVELQHTLTKGTSALGHWLGIEHATLWSQTRSLNQ